MGWSSYIIGLLSAPSPIITPFSGLAIFKVEPNYTFIHMNKSFGQQYFEIYMNINEILNIV